MVWCATKTITVVVLLSVATAAQAQSTICGQRAQVIERISTRYGEALIGYGLQNAKFVIEVWASAQTWTILRTGVTGMSCILAVGKGWVPAPAPQLADPGERI